MAGKPWRLRTQPVERQTVKNEDGAQWRATWCCGNLWCRLSITDWLLSRQTSMFVHYFCCLLKWFPWRSLGPAASGREQRYVELFDSQHQHSHNDRVSGVGERESWYNCTLTDWKMKCITPCESVSVNKIYTGNLLTCAQNVLWFQAWVQFPQLPSLPIGHPALNRLH